MNMDPRTPERITIINPNADIDDDDIDPDDFDFPEPDEEEGFDIGGPDYIPDETEFIR